MSEDDLARLMKPFDDISRAMDEIAKSMDALGQEIDREIPGSATVKVIVIKQEGILKTMKKRWFS